MSVFTASAALLGGYIAVPPSPDWNTEGSNNTITVFSQPPVPSAPVTTGSNLTITVTG